MSEENIEVVRHSFDTFNAFMRGELTSAGYDEPFDPQIELRWRDQRTYPDAPGAGPVVVIRVRTSVTGGQSGIGPEIRSSQVITLRRGKAVLLEYFWDHQEPSKPPGCRGRAGVI